jgi:hypothetical protein
MQEVISADVQARRVLRNPPRRFRGNSKADEAIMTDLFTPMDLNGLRFPIAFGCQR